MTVPTWRELIAAEPALRELEADVLGHFVDPPLGYCRQSTWYGFGADSPGLKAEMTAIMHRLPAVDSAYDIAYHHLYGLLPPCVGPCGCVDHLLGGGSAGR